MSVDCVNALDNVDYTLLMTICPRFVCLSRVSLVADTHIIMHAYQVLATPGMHKYDKTSTSDRYPGTRVLHGEEGIVPVPTLRQRRLDVRLPTHTSVVERTK